MPGRLPTEMSLAQDGLRYRQEQSMPVAYHADAYIRTYAYGYYHDWE
jgi:hypothetical protein